MSEPFLKHTGLAASLIRDNVDTDQIIPSREMKTVSRDGLADGLFAGWRYTEPGTRHVDPDFVLNRADQAGSTILISGKNFGCGSSREHAVWALKEYGFRAIIAESFGEIFHGNCMRNGILPIALAEDVIAPIANGPVTLTIDLPEQRVYCDAMPDWDATFEIDAFAKRLLTEGLDPISLTLKESPTIAAFLARDADQRPWIYSAG